MKIFLISPVARITEEERAQIEKYVAGLEAQGHQVHLPIRDTNQVDETGGYRICKDNLRAILRADEVHIWYNETSGGSKFDIGMVFVLDQLAYALPTHISKPKKIVVPNLEAALTTDMHNAKSFIKLLNHHLELSK